jgi:ketose-bisphosphate aldolase
MKEMLLRARREGYAVGYFESWNLESLKAVVKAAEEERSPVIIGFNGGMLTDASRILEPENLEYYGAMGGIAAKYASVPVALILNEIESFQLAIAGIKFGFNALMYECGSGDFGRNIEETARVVEAAHAAGVSVESNVGILPSIDPSGMRGGKKESSLTKPEDAKSIVEETGVDAIGVSIGNVEVMLEGKATLDFALLGKINEAANIPLTLHGGSGIADENVKSLVQHGLCKMNIGAALNKAFFEGMQKVQGSLKDYVSPKFFIGSGLKDDIMAGGEISLKEFVKLKMRVYGSSGKAG